MEKKTLEKCNVMRIHNFKKLWPLRINVVFKILKKKKNMNRQKLL